MTRTMHRLLSMLMVSALASFRSQIEHHSEMFQAATNFPSHSGCPFADATSENQQIESA